MNVAKAYDTKIQYEKLKVVEISVLLHLTLSQLKYEWVFISLFLVVQSLSRFQL